MPKLLLSHHTLTDWDFTPSMYRGLTTTQYVSPPSSLLLQVIAGTPNRGYVICREASVLCLPQAEFRTWARRTGGTVFWSMIFRNQAPVGSASVANTYEWRITNQYSYLFKTISGVEELLATIGHTWTANVWHHFKTIFWNGTDPLGTPALCVQIFEEVAGAWTQYGDTIYDTDNEWKDSATNRLGIGADVHTVYKYYIDDTEIWGPA